jgi:hypothetical protein
VRSHDLIFFFLYILLLVFYPTFCLSFHIIIIIFRIYLPLKIEKFRRGEKLLFYEYSIINYLFLLHTYIYSTHVNTSFMLFFDPVRFHIFLFIHTTTSILLGLLSLLSLKHQRTESIAFFVFFMRHKMMMLILWLFGCHFLLFQFSSFCLI